MGKFVIILLLCALVAFCCAEDDKKETNVINDLQATISQHLADAKKFFDEGKAKEFMDKLAENAREFVDSTKQKFDQAKNT